MALLEKSPNKTVQTGAALCLSKIIQNSPEEVLIELLGEMTDRIIAVTKLTSFKAPTPLLECIISIVFHVELDFAPFVPRLIPMLIDFINNDEWSTKKVAIDAVYSIAAILKEQILPFRVDILKVLANCRFDKVKPVREATTETIKLLKEISPPLDDKQLSELIQGTKPKKPDNRSGSGNRIIKKQFAEGPISDESEVREKKFGRRQP